MEDPQELEYMPEYRISQALRIKEEELLLSRQFEEIPNESTFERNLRIKSAKASTLPRPRVHEELPSVKLTRARTASDATRTEDNSLTVFYWSYNL